MALITATEYKTWAGISGTDLDTWLTAVLPQAQDYAEAWCDRNFESAERTEYYDGHGTETIQLRSPPVTAVGSVSYRSGVSAGVATFTAFDSGTYWFDQTSGLLTRFSSFDVFPSTIDRYERAVWPESVRGLKVVYTGGYGAGGGPAVPSGLKLAMFRMIDFLRGQRGRDGSMQSETMGSYSYTRAALAATVSDDRMYEFGFGQYRKGMA